MTNDNDNKKPEDQAQPEETATQAAADGAADTPAEEAAAEDTSPEGQLATAHEEIAELKDRLLRAMAETENIRRRSAREKEDAAKYAIANFARDMVNAADNLGRALDALPENAREDETFKGLIEGVELTGREFVSAFEKHGIKEVHPHGEKFDHNLHQAMFEVEDPSVEPGTVIQVMQIGYTIGDRLLRPAMVGVAKAAKPAEDATESSPNDAGAES